MNSLVKVFSNFKEFYSEINGATLTGAIDVIVVEQPDGTYLCSPFHVRFGKLGVLRSREKVVDIEVNGEPVSIHMKLGESGEAFFVEECEENDLSELPEHMATSPLPTDTFSKFMNDQLYEGENESNDGAMRLMRPRRNSIDLSTEAENLEKKYENQVSDYSSRRHTDNTIERRDLSVAKKEFTTQKIRQEWAEHEEKLFLRGNEAAAAVGTDNDDVAADAGATIGAATPSIKSKPCQIGATAAATTSKDESSIPQSITGSDNQQIKEDTKSKKKRRKKSMIKKKNAQRKSSSSSSLGSTISSEQIDASASDTNNKATTDTSTSESIKAGGGGGGGDVSEEQSTPTTTNINTIQETTTAAAASSSSSIQQQQQQQQQQQRFGDLDIHFFSDTELQSAKSPQTSRPQTPIQSDSELEKSHRGHHSQLNKNCTETSASWKWGELPTPPQIPITSSVANAEDAKNAQRQSMLSNMFSFMKQTKKMRKNQTDGIYLSDLDPERMDPKIADLYFPTAAAVATTTTTVTATATTPTTKNLPNNNNDDNDDADDKYQSEKIDDDDIESGNGTSIIHSPSSLESPKSLDSDFEDGKHTELRYLDFVALSLCGGLDQQNGPTNDQFNRHVIQYSEVCQNPSIFSSPHLVVRLNGKYYSWAAACPIVMSILAFQKPLTNDAVEQIINATKPQDSGIIDTEQRKQRGYSWWYWRRSDNKSEPKQMNTNNSFEHKSDELNVSSLQQQQQQQTLQQQSLQQQQQHDNIVTKNNTQQQLQQQQIPNERKLLNEFTDVTDDMVLNNSGTTTATDGGASKLNEMFKKSLRLSSDQIACLNLKDGMNEISFSVTTAYQGTSRCKCYLFKWKHNDKVVISDIDGTITKSDVLGHILPMVGKDWAQIGVAQLFSKIEENGYKLLYLSARAIGQSRVTREYLRSIRQGDVKLPDGPLLLNPTSLISAFHREVIERKPEQFKIACLSDIQALFPQNPFYAGYGNRINDVWAYTAVGIPIMRIFTINPKGELKHELTQTFQSTYCNMTYIVDQLFPPTRNVEESIEYSNINYWREPILNIDTDLINALCVQ